MFPCISLDFFLMYVSQAYHPSNVVNKYLIRANPDAQVAVTHESDWWTFFDDVNMPPIS
jgi:hypothetical protein